MVATPNWSAATAGQNTNAGQVNQFLGTHSSTIIYVGTQQAAQLTAGSGGVNSNSTYLQQTFTTGASQTQIGRVVLTIGATGTPAPLTVSIQADSSGNPSGTPIVTTLVPQEFVTGAPVIMTIPVPCTVTANTVYHIVTNAVGDPSNFYTWNKSNQVTGASTSTNGSTWTAQAYGLLYQEYDQAVIQPWRHTWEDGGVRWTRTGLNGVSGIGNLWEYTAGQTATGYIASLRTFTYTNGQLTSIA